MADSTEKRCYVCGRTKKEVEDYFFTAHDPDKDEPLMEDHIGVSFSSLCLCVGCSDLICGMLIKEKEYLRSFVAQQISETIDKIIESLNIEKSRISELF